MLLLVSPIVPCNTVFGSQHSMVRCVWTVSELLFNYEIHCTDCPNWDTTLTNKGSPHTHCHITSTIRITLSSQDVSWLDSDAYTPPIVQDVAALDKRINDDLTEGKVPVMVIAYAGNTCTVCTSRTCLKAVAQSCHDFTALVERSLCGLEP